MSKSPYFPNRDNKFIILLKGTIRLLPYLTRDLILIGISLHWV
jgi:hypothetical protein